MSTDFCTTNKNVYCHIAKRLFRLIKQVDVGWLSTFEKSHEGYISVVLCQDPPFQRAEYLWPFERFKRC